MHAVGRFVVEEDEPEPPNRGIIITFGGEAWTTTYEGTSEPTSIWGFAENEVYAVGHTWGDNTWRGAALRYNGTSWSDLSIDPIRAGLTGVWGTSGDNLYVTGGSMLIRYDGSTWEILSSGEPESLGELWGSSADDIFTLGSPIHSDCGKSVVYHFNGQALAESYRPLCGTLERIRGRSQDDIYVVGSSGLSDLIAHYDGQTWTQVEGAFMAEMKDIWLDDDGGAVAVGDWGEIRSFDGTSWDEQNYEGEHRFWSVGGRSMSDYYLADGRSPEMFETQGSVLHFDGTEFSKIWSGDVFLRAVWALPGESKAILAGGRFPSSDPMKALEDGIILECDLEQCREEHTLPLALFRGIWGTSTGEVIVGGSQPHEALGDVTILLRYDGNSWSTMLQTPLGYIADVWGDDKGNLLVAGASRLIFDGETWWRMGVTDVLDRDGIVINSIWGSPDEGMYMVGPRGTMLRGTCE